MPVPGIHLDCGLSFGFDRQTPKRRHLSPARCVQRVAGIGGTRVGVHDVIGLLQNGETVDSVVTRCFPNITRAQVYECLAYYEDHRGEIDVLVARQMSAPTP